MGRTNKDLIQILINYSPLEKVLFSKRLIAPFPESSTK